MVFAGPLDRGGVTIETDRVQVSPISLVKLLPRIRAVPAVAAAFEAYASELVRRPSARYDGATADAEGWSTSPTANPPSRPRGHPGRPRRSPRLAGIGHVHREAGHPDPGGQDGVRRTLRGVRRAAARAGAAPGKTRPQRLPE